jgi:uncharacterized protein YkwD
MYRVVIPALACLWLAGCGMAVGSSLSSGFADSNPTTGALSTRHANAADVGAAKVQREAKADDRIPKGTYEKAPHGALSDRDYTGTRLDSHKALALINAYRKSKGLKPLALNAQLSEAAKAHSADLAKWDRISHYGSDGSNPWDRVKRVGYHAKLAAEHVGTGQVTIEEVMKGWEASPGHNKNLLLADAKQMGIALVQDPKTEFKTFWTLVIGAPL